jgi:hypothetical protein
MIYNNGIETGFSKSSEMERFLAFHCIISTFL